jgi:hypothetical protein
MTELSCGDPGGPIAVRKWIGDVSAERVGQVWRTEDHEALLRAMRVADETYVRACCASQGRRLGNEFEFPRKERCPWNPIED